MVAALAIAATVVGVSAEAAGAKPMPVSSTTASSPTTVPPPTTRPAPTYPPVTVKRTTPVRGPIVDPWRPPASPYGPGNRGIDIGTTPGAIVVSPADGRVSFAGAVGSDRFVVVESSDGIRITVGFLMEVRVRSGQVVRRGQTIGRAGTSVHVGARIDDDYVDPTPLFSGGPPHVRLIPVAARSAAGAGGTAGAAEAAGVGSR